MKLNLSLAAIALFLFPIQTALAVDHNNLDAGHPLPFEDAESIAFGEHSLELGASVNFPRDRSVGGGFSVEYLYGFAPNTHLQVSIDPSIGGRADSEETDFDIGNLSLGALHNFNREYDNVPALAVRGDVEFPTGRDSRGVAVKLRGIASKTVTQYGRLHFNLDLTLKTDVESSEDRSLIPAVILGYSQPLSYPRSFEHTFLAQIGVRANEDATAAPLLTPGIGLRQQLGIQGVLDIGVEGDIATGGGERSELRLRIGYSLGF